MTAGRGPGSLHRRRRLRGARPAAAFDARPRQGQGRGQARNGPRSRRCAKPSCAAARPARSRSRASTSASCDQLPIGAFVNKGLTIKTGQTHVHRYIEPLLAKIESKRDRSGVRHHAPRSPGRGARALQDLPRQEGRLHQGGAASELSDAQAAARSASRSRSSASSCGSTRRPPANRARCARRPSSWCDRRCRRRRRRRAARA